MRSWITSALLSVAALVVCSVAVIFVMRAGWRTGVSDAWVATSTQMQLRVVQCVDSQVTFAQFSARSVPTFGSVSITDADPEQLTRAFDAHYRFSGYDISSLGAITPDGSGGKYEQQVAYGYGCPQYIYCYTNASNTPAFDCYCAWANGTVSWTDLDYRGTTWNLTGLEAAILAGDNTGEFTPVHGLLGQQLLTYETGYSIGTAQAAVLFTDVDLRQLAQLVAAFEPPAMAYVAETGGGGAMIACTDPSYVYSNGTRHYAYNSTSDVLRNTYGSPPVSDASIDGWRYSSYRYNRTDGIDWQIVVAMPESAVYGDINSSIAKAAGGCVAIIVVFALCIVAVHLVFYEPGLQYLAARIRGENPTPPRAAFSELRELDEEIDRRSAAPSKP